MSKRKISSSFSPWETPKILNKENKSSSSQNKEKNIIISLKPINFLNKNKSSSSQDKEKDFSLLQYYPLNHEINKINLERFINASDLSVRTIIRKIIKHTLHISFERFLLSFNEIIKKLLEFRQSIKITERPIFVYLDITYENYKQKSNYWLYILLKSNLNKIKIKLINKIDDSEIKDDDIIVFLDDAIYSGQQMGNTLFKFNNNKKIKLNLCLLVPYITTKGENLIKKVKKHNHTLDNCDLIFFNYLLIENDTNKILTDDEIKTIEEFYPYFFETFDDKYLLYFDHKLADLVSTIPIFYSGLVPNTYNKDIIKRSDNYDKLLFIPFINNCEGIRNLDSDTPECPYPHYKTKGFIKLISKIKLDKKERKANSEPIIKRTISDKKERKTLSSPRIKK